MISDSLAAAAIPASQLNSLLTIDELFQFLALLDPQETPELVAPAWLAPSDAAGKGLRPQAAATGTPIENLAAATNKPIGGVLRLSAVETLDFHPRIRPAIEATKEQQRVTPSQSNQPPIYGYLQVVEDRALGYTGGLLVVCDRGRPLEFHCTEPVKPSRAQEILFGPTLRSYLLGGLIGGALLAQAKLDLSVLLVNDPDALGVASGKGIGAHLLTDAAPVEPTLETDQGDGASEGERTHALIAHLSEAIDPAEPFERVREAIREAQRMVAAEAGGGSTAEGETRVAA